MIHVVDQMLESDWFSEETMTTWEEFLDNEKQSKCQQFFENAYIAKKLYTDAKGPKKENVSKIKEADLHIYLAAIDTTTEQETKEHDEHIKQVTEQNAILLSLVQDEQKKIVYLIMQSKTPCHQTGSCDGQRRQRTDGASTARQ